MSVQYIFIKLHIAFILSLPCTMHKINANFIIEEIFDIKRHASHL